MSDYQRWEPLDERTMRQSPDGGWVLIGDYSCLKREAYILSNECKNLQSENARLKAEVERLRKAGDAMVPLLGRGDYHDARINWNAAKEGKQP